VGPPGEEQDSGPGTDFDAVRRGFVSVTPLTVDLTKYDNLGEIEHWVEELNP
jgi:5'-nucleotidase